MSKSMNSGKLVFKYKDTNIHEQQTEYQVGTDSDHMVLYPELLLPDKSTAPETLTNSNCIYVSNVSGNDSTGTGTSANPYKTIDKAIQIFDAQATRIKKYIGVSDQFIYVENIVIPYWLQGNIYKVDTNTPSIRFIRRSAAMTSLNAANNTNAKWVDIVSGNDSTGTGTEAAPYKTIQKAIDSITTSAFIYIPVLVPDSSTTNVSIENLTRIPSNTSSVQSIEIIPYIKQGSVKTVGRELVLQSKLDQVHHGVSTSTFANTDIWYQSVTSNCYSNTGVERTFINVYNSTQYKLYYTEDFINWSNIGSSTGFFTGLGETYKLTGTSSTNYDHYLVRSRNDTYNTTPELKLYKGNNLSSSYTVALPAMLNNGNSTKPSFVLSNMTNYHTDKPLCVVTYDTASNYYVYIKNTNENIESTSDWSNSLIHSSSGWLYINSLKSNNMFIFNDTNNKTMVRVVRNGSIVNFTSLYNYLYFFEYDGGTFGLTTTPNNNKYLSLVQLDIDFSTTTITETILVEHAFDKSTLNGLIEYNNSVYFMNKSELFVFDGEKFNQTANNTTMQPESNNRYYKNRGHKGVYVDLKNISGTATIVSVNLSQIAALAPIKIINTRLDGKHIGSNMSGNKIEAVNCNLRDNRDGMIARNMRTTPAKSCCIFDNVDFPIMCGGHTPAINIANSRFHNMKTAIQYNHVKSTLAAGSKITVDNCTFTDGSKVMLCNYRSSMVSNDVSSIEDCVIADIRYIYSGDERYNGVVGTGMVIKNNILPNNSFISSATIESTNKTGIALFRDSDNDDYRLQNKYVTDSDGEYYIMNSPGVAMGDSFTPAGKDSGWNVYSSTDADIGCYEIVTAPWGVTEGDAICLHHAPDSLTYKMNILNNNIKRAIDGTAHKVLDIIKREFSFKWAQNSSITQEQFYLIVRLYRETNGLRMYLNPIIPNADIVNHASILDFSDYFTFATSADWTNSDLKTNIEAGNYGWISGSATITDMTMPISAVDSQYKGLFITIFETPASYPGSLIVREYKITNNTSSLITLDDYWDIGDISNGTYHYVISNALVLFDTQSIQSTQMPVFGGLNINELPLTSQSITLQEV